MSNLFKEHLSSSVDEERKRKEEEKITIKLLSFLQKGRRLTEKEKKEFWEIDESMISKEMYRMIYELIKTVIETGEVPKIEDYAESYKKRGRKISLDQIPEKWEKAPEEWER